MKTSIELKELRSDIISQLENIKDVASTEKRDLTEDENNQVDGLLTDCLLYTSPSPRDVEESRMPSSA